MTVRIAISDRNDLWGARQDEQRRWHVRLAREVLAWGEDNGIDLRLESTDDLYHVQVVLPDVSAAMLFTMRWL